ncbi:hypothetical protein D3C72_1590290 [compost metagenome]
MALGATIFVGLAIPFEVAARQTVVLALGSVPDGDVRLYPLVLHHPRQHRSRAVSSIADEPIRDDVESFLDTIHHRLGRVHFCGAMCRGGFDVEDHAMLGIDQIFCRISEECGTARGGRPP